MSSYHVLGLTRLPQERLGESYGPLLSDWITFTIDGEDLLDLLVGPDWWGDDRGLVGYALGTAANNPAGSVFAGAPFFRGRQEVLHIHIGDTIVPFVSAEVRSSICAIHWSSFGDYPGFRTPFRAIGPFAFRRRNYHRVLAEARTLGRGRDV